MNAASPPEMKLVYDLLAAIATDPVGARERLDQIATATETARQATEDAKAAQAALDQQRADHQRKLDEAHEEHKARLTQDRAELEKEFDGRRVALARREAALQASEEQLRTDRARFAAEANDHMAQLNAERASVENQRARLRR
jgi:chromosome segregation ATPase